VPHKCGGGCAISNISLRWMVQEIVAAGHHDLFATNAQQFFPRITIPEPPLLIQKKAQDAGAQENLSDPLDIGDLMQGMPVEK
jgi:hypothetical protein